jgi:hypothetical protein
MEPCWKKSMILPLKLLLTPIQIPEHMLRVSQNSVPWERILPVIATLVCQPLGVALNQHIGVKRTRIAVFVSNHTMCKCENYALHLCLHHHLRQHHQMVEFV